MAMTSPTSSPRIGHTHHPRGIGGTIGIVLMLIVLPLGHPDSSWHWVQLATLVALLGSWGVVCCCLMSATASQKQERIARMQRAVKRRVIDGLNQSWYCAVSSSAQGFACLATAACAALVVFAAKHSYPSSIYAALSNQLTMIWISLRVRYSEPTLFLGACVYSHFIIFWVVGLASAALEFTRPACLEPFKVQQDAPRLTFGRFAQGCVLALLNQLTLVIACLLVLRGCPFVVGPAFAAELPSLPEALVQLACCIPVSEALFYVGHRVLHVPWAYDHIHYIHHSWDAPIAIASIYAHPAEFILANIPVVLGGPLLVTPHLIVWFIWCCAATLLILSGHLGWHLPFGLPSPEAHDFHHSHFGGRNTNNLGQIGVLDAFFCTEKDWVVAWQRHTDKAYWGADYPVDKALAFPPVPRNVEKVAAKVCERQCGKVGAVRALVWAVSLLAIGSGAAACVLPTSILVPVVGTVQDDSEMRATSKSALSLHHAVPILDALGRYNRSEAASAQVLCAGAIGNATAKMMHAGFVAAAPNMPSPQQLPRGCYFLCIAGAATQPLSKALGKIPWDGKCFRGNGSLINQFGQAGHACASRLDGLQATYAGGASWADPTGGGAIVIEYHGAVAAMRDEIRDAGDAIGYSALRDTWLGKFYLARMPVADFLLMPVQCTLSEKMQHAT